MDGDMGIVVAVATVCAAVVTIIGFPAGLIRSRSQRRRRDQEKLAALEENEQKLLQERRRHEQDRVNAEEAQRREAIKDCLQQNHELPKVEEIANLADVGVHLSSTADGLVIPPYVERDIDDVLRPLLRRGLNRHSTRTTDEPGRDERANGRAGALGQEEETEGFILLIGESTAGKTRTAFQALLAEVPEHVLIAPGPQADLDALLTEVSALDKCVLWLDEIQHFLRTNGLRRQDVNRFLEGDDHQRFIVATITQEEYESRTIDQNTKEMAHYTLRTLLMSTKVRLKTTFSVEERARASDSDDRLIRDALSHADGRLPGFFAGAPSLLERWLNASNGGDHVLGAALVSAAVDCQRAGLSRPIPRALIEEIHESYLAEGDIYSDDMATAWDWATTPRPNVALLKPSLWPKKEPGALPAVEVFDYLVGRTSNRHVLDVTLLASLHYADDTEAARIGRRAYSYGRFAIAETAYTRAVAIRGQQELRGPATLTSRDTLARIWRVQGRLDKAEREHRAVLRIRQELLLLAQQSRLPDSEQEELQRDILTSKDNLGRVLRAQGRLDEAEKLHREVLERRRESKLAPDHPDMLKSQMYLALVACRRGDHEEALKGLEEVLDLRRAAARGDDQPYTPEDQLDILIARNYVANELRHLGRFVDALAEFDDIIERRTRGLGPAHPDTLISRHHRALTLAALGRLLEARAELEDVIAQRIENLGPEHPDVVAAHNDLAQVIRMLAADDEPKSD